MPNKCNVVNCRGNYDKENKCRVFKLPKDEAERKDWVSKIPLRQDFDIVPDKFFICENHWPSDYPVIKVPGGSRPANPPSVFDVPESCKPTPTSRRHTDVTNIEQRQIEYLKTLDSVSTFADFNPEQTLRKLYGEHLLITRSDEKLVCVFMKDDYSDSLLSIVIENKATLTSPLTLKAYKSGVRVPLGAYLHPNNGFKSRQMFFDAVRRAVNYELQCNILIEKALVLLGPHDTDTCASDFCKDSSKGRKLSFIKHQLELLSEKSYTLQDYCFALEAFPHCKYEGLRDYLTLPSKRKLQSVVSSVDIAPVLVKTFEKVEVEQQKNVFLLVDEVKIRPTVSFDLWWCYQWDGKKQR